MIISSKDYKIQFFEEPEYVTKHSEKIENVIDKFLPFFFVSKLEVDISFCTENEITKLNKKFRGKNNPTNVLSFPDKEQKNISNECIGELMICQKVLEKEAFDQEKKIFDHFIHLVIHSLLHILGYAHEDKNDAILMESKEIEFLSKIGVKDPYK